MVSAAECPPQFEDCLTVKGKRINCPDGALCSDGFPKNLGIACIKSMVDFPNPVISSVHGEQRDGYRHNGIDIAVPTGTVLNATKDGVVADIEGSLPIGDRTTLNGNFIEVNHDDGTVGVYLHLMEVYVKVGEAVDAGFAIGKTNDTGRSRGPHVHYTEYKNKSKKRSIEHTNDPAKVHGNCS